MMSIHVSATHLLCVWMVHPLHACWCVLPSPSSLLCVARSVMIHNRSDVVVHYEWKAFSSDLEEQAEKDM